MDSAIVSNETMNDVEMHENNRGDFTGVMMQLLEHMNKVHSEPPVEPKPDAAATLLQYQEHCTLQQLSALIESSLGPLPSDNDYSHTFQLAELSNSDDNYTQNITTNDACTFNLTDLNINSIQFGKLPDGFSSEGSCPVIIVNVQAPPQYYEQQPKAIEQCHYAEPATYPFMPMENNTTHEQTSIKLRRQHLKRRRSIEQSDYDRDSKRSKFDNNDQSFNSASLPPNHATNEQQQDDMLFSKLMNICDDNLLTPSGFLTPSCFAYSQAACNQQHQILDDMTTQPSTPNTDLKLLEFLLNQPTPVYNPLHCTKQSVEE
jgi:hypothetical protein